MGAVLGEEDAIVFPKSLSSSDPEALIGFCQQILKTADEPITALNAEQLGFIDPLGLAAFRAALDTVDHAKPDKEYNLQWMDEHLTRYLSRMDFFQGIDVEGLDQYSGPALQSDPTNCVELRQIREDNSEEVASQLVSAITGLSQDDAPFEEADKFKRPIEYALKELLGNALSHARRDGNGNASVWVACQHFVDNGTVRLAIVDNGCGFLATLKDHAKLIEPTDAGAIKTALLERVSCNRGPFVAYETDSQNQGVGLTTTARIAEAAGGRLVIASGDAWYDTESGQARVMEGVRWNGVAIAFACKRDLLPGVNIPALLPTVEEDPDLDLSFDD